MKKEMIMLAFLLLAVEIVFAQTSNSQSNFIVSGCDLPGGKSIRVGECSSDGRYFCRNTASGGILQDTITTGGACTLTGVEQCCPAGYLCGGGSSGKCDLRTTPCSSSTYNSKTACEAAKCFWIGSVSAGICVDRPRDYGCNVYKDSASCAADIWNLGSIGMGTDACDGRYITNGTLGVVIPKSSCKCEWRAGTCFLSYMAKNDLYAVSVTSPPDTFTCQKSFTDSSPCLNGKQGITWNGSVTGKTGLFSSMVNGFDNYKDRADCKDGNKDRVCGYETMKLPGASAFSFFFAFGLLALFYFYTSRRNDL